MLHDIIQELVPRNRWPFWGLKRAVWAYLLHRHAYKTLLVVLCLDRGCCLEFVVVLRKAECGIGFVPKYLTRGVFPRQHGKVLDAMQHAWRLAEREATLCAPTSLLCIYLEKIRLQRIYPTKAQASLCQFFTYAQSRGTLKYLTLPTRISRCRRESLISFTVEIEDLGK